MRQYKIDITLEPPIKSYQWYAYPLSILFAKNNDYLPWLYNHYIPIYAKKDFSMFELILYDWMHLKEEVFRYNFSKFHLNTPNIIEIIQSMLVNDHFVLGMFNQRYVPKRSGYQKFDEDHDYMIIGFDDEKESFILLGYTDNFIYSETYILYSEYIEAVKNLLAIENKTEKEKLIEFHVIVQNPDFKPKFDFRACITQISEYMCSCESSKWTKLEGEKIDDFIFGIKSILYLTDYLDYVDRHNQEYLELRFLCMLKDHKKLMSMRINYSMERGYIPDHLRKLCCGYNKISEEADKVVFLGIKFNITKDKALLHIIRDKIFHIVESEYEILIPLVEESR